MMVSVFIGTSVDGFIARLNGDLDFLPEGGGEPHGYNEFMASVDALVIGRKTFETVLAFPEWPYGDKRVVVLSSRPARLLDNPQKLDRRRRRADVRHSRRRSLRNSPRAASNTSTSTEESRFKDSCAPDWFIVSPSPACQCSSAKESRSSAACRATCGFATWPRSTIRAAW